MTMTITAHPQIAASVLDDLATARAGLEEISGRWPADMPEPEPEDYDDTESAYSNGEDVGLHCCASIARETLAKLGAPSPSAAPPAPSDAPADPRGEAFNGLVDALDGLVGNGFSDEELARRWKWSAAAIQKARTELASARLIEAVPVPADPVKAEMLAALKRLAEIIRDRHRLHGEDIGYALASLKDAEAIIARAEGRA